MRGNQLKVTLFRSNVPMPSLPEGCTPPTSSHLTSLGVGGRGLVPDQVLVLDPDPVLVPDPVLIPDPVLDLFLDLVPDPVPDMVPDPVSVPDLVLGPGLDLGLDPGRCAYDSSESNSDG